MCGIAGWIGAGLPRDQGQAVLTTMTGLLAHRGPDDEGRRFLPLPSGAEAAFGHRRLSIIDLADGAQPMASHDGRLSIVFNGEIYNYIELRAELAAKGARFNTQSDTEVILEAWRAWGPEALPRFRGMFAFALHDAVEGRVVLARDPFGKKPLYMAERATSQGPVLVFGSEIEALLAHPAVTPELEEAALHDFLCWRYAPGPGTFFKGVRKLVPGGWLEWKDGRTTERRYWLPPEEREVHAASPPPEDEAIEAFLALFDEAVRLRLRSDVPLGAFLSGGLDSAAIVATLAHLGAPDIRTFSVGFAGDPASELPAAAETARVLGADHTPVEVEASGLHALMPHLTRRRGAPVTEPSDLPLYVMAKEASRHVKVVLSGEGSDEMFAGYPKHLAEMYMGYLAPMGLSPLVRHGIGAAAHIPGLGGGRRLAIASRALAEQGFEERMVRWFGAMTPAERSSMWTGPEPAERPGGSRAGFAAIPFQARAGASPLARALQFDQTSWLPDNTLERMDMMTMAASIEGRTPFLDVRLAEFASALPAHWRIRGLTTKRIVRLALAPRLPAAVIQRPKNGFRLPVGAWFRGPLREPFVDLLLGPDSVSGAYLSREALERLLADHVSGRRQNDKTLWALYALETFLRTFFRA